MSVRPARAQPAAAAGGGGTHNRAQRTLSPLEKPLLANTRTARARPLLLLECAPRSTLRCARVESAAAAHDIGARILVVEGRLYDVCWCSGTWLLAQQTRERIDSRLSAATAVRA